MSPAQRRRKKIAHRTKKHNLLLPLVLVLLLVLVIGFIYVLAKPRFWDGKNKLSLVLPNGEGVSVINFDPTLGQIAEIDIPANTQVNVSRSLGVWRIGSVLKLGQDEKLDGELLRETIVKNFNFPVTSWSNSNASFYYDAHVSHLMSIFSPIKTNLSLVDRIKLYLFATSIPDSKKTKIDLAKSVMLKKTVLTDGNSGYLLTGLTQSELIGTFSNSSNSNLLSVSIDDASGDRGIAPQLGKIIDYLGAKVVSRRELPTSNDDCTIISLDEILTKQLSNILGCKTISKAANGNYDVEISIGTGFAKRF